MKVEHQDIITIPDQSGGDIQHSDIFIVTILSGPMHHDDDTVAALVVTPIRTMVQIGTAVAIGVFLDTFIVRALLVPAIDSLLGRWNWYPDRHSRTPGK